MKKSARTISGVTPVAVMSEPMGCPGECVYCPTFADTPQSYTPESPAVLRGDRCDYDAARQVRTRLDAFAGMGHPTDKIELIVMGGTFLAAPPDYASRFIKGCYDALNGSHSASLDEAQRRNQTAAHRCVGLCIETRPDRCGPEEVRRMLEFGATRVELGVQMLDDDVYRLVRRGHTVADVVAATARLRRHGFKVHYHWMPGLPGSTPEKDLALSRMLFEDARFRPDGLKLYPTMVIEGTELERWYRQGRYVPYPTGTMIDLMADIKALVPGYVRISRVLRDIPARYIVAGCRDSIRDAVRERLEQRGLSCRCIRCREYGHRVLRGLPVGEPRMVRQDYAAGDGTSGGREVFLSWEDEAGALFGLLRLRIQPQPLPGVDRPQGDGPVAIVRELHVYGPEAPLRAARSEASAQHRGLGRALLEEAERIAGDEFQAGRLAVLSGVGAREYYLARNESGQGSGYTRQGAYMVRRLGPDGGSRTDAGILHGPAEQSL